jgi:hypothetical protein
MVINSSSVLVVFGRAFWIMIGPMLLTATALMILTKPGWRTGADITFLATLAGMILGRLLEHLGGNPQTSTGEPSTPADLRRFVLFTLVGGLALWLVANLIANYVLA